jgi:hypothetical protein
MTVGTEGSRQFQSLGHVIPFVGSVTLTAAAGAETQASVTVPGATPGDIVLWGLDEDTEAGAVSANVNTAGAVEFVLVNATGSTITIASAPIYGIVIKTDGSLWQSLGGRALGA